MEDPSSSQGASPSALLQAGLRQGTSDKKGRDLCQKCTELFPLLNLSGSLAKMCQGLLHFQWYSRERLLTWKHQAIRQSVSITCATNLKHERQRLWIVAHSESSRHRGGLSEERGTEGRLILQSEQGRSAMGSEAEGCSELSGDVISGNQGLQRHKLLRENKAEDRTGGKRSHGATSQLHNDEGRREVRGSFESRLGGKLSDGLSDRMDESEFEFQESQPKSKTEQHDSKQLEMPSSPQSQKSSQEQS